MGLWLFERQDALPEIRDAGMDSPKEARTDFIALSRSFDGGGLVADPEKRRASGKNFAASAAVKGESRGLADCMKPKL
jgi:hypothetical protein